MWGGKTQKTIRIVFAIVAILVAASMVVSGFAYTLF
jgi:hypothetical protein